MLVHVLLDTFFFDALHHITLKYPLEVLSDVLLGLDKTVNKRNKNMSNGMIAV